MCFISFKIQTPGGVQIKMTSFEFQRNKHKQLLSGGLLKKKQESKMLYKLTSYYFNITKEQFGMSFYRPSQKYTYFVKGLLKIFLTPSKDPVHSIQCF